MMLGWFIFFQIDTETGLGHGLVGLDEPLGRTEDAGPFGLIKPANQLAYQ
jgi:hypothetical protein